ncbi:hypothetical protein HAX54_010767 [Datura stramonium]|uniref:Uncharacterized protein n=1 Tax=Datura stramonium TaxID=4076 RepID=A0ABS8RID6_DATST|nr:hypothetical protein [Datura stramonium]
MVSEPCRLYFIASCTRMEEGGDELRDPHITKCRVWQGREHRAAGDRESGNSGEWPCTRAYTDMGGGGVHAPSERGILRRTVAGGWIRRLIEWLQKGCGVVTSASPSESRQANPVKCWELVDVLGIDGEEGTWPTLHKPGRELEPEKLVDYPGEKGWPQRRGTAWASGACRKSEPVTHGIRARSIPVWALSPHASRAWAVNQLGDADEVLNECVVAFMARMSNKLTGHDFSATSASSSSLHSKRWIAAVNQLGDANEVLNECVVAVMARMSNKLTGHDFAATYASSSSLHSKRWIAVC